MKTAIVHEWFTAWAGSENVVGRLLDLYPDADIYAMVDFLSDEDRKRLNGRKVTTSFIQKMPKASKRYRNYLPLMPLAVEQFDLSDYDLVISSSHAVAKGVLTGPDTLHVSYVHSPMRYAWDLQHQYLTEAGLTQGLKSWLARYMLHKMRIWDVRTAHGVDQFMANSSFIARRIKKVYGRESLVVHPPVDTDFFTVDENVEREDFYLAASRFVPYKKMALIAEAFTRMPGRKLVMIGDGPEFERAKEKAGKNVTFLGYQDNEVLRDHMRRAKAFVFAALEDFGILPLEAQACGCPVIAYGRGGALDTVKPGETGLFFEEQKYQSIVGAVTGFERRNDVFPADVCRKHAEGFAAESFDAAFKEVVDAALNARKQG